jgi:cell division protein FtsI/penicillin-binding protein 2
LVLSAGALLFRLGLMLSNTPVREARARQAVRQQRMVIPLPARPGNIFAHALNRYVLLAGSKQVPSCYVDPGMISDSDLAEASIRVGEALGISPVEVQNTVMMRRPGRFAWVKHDITDSQAEKIQKLDIPAFGITYEWRRDYPNAALGATVLGFRRHDGVGGAGVELAQEKYLTAVEGKKIVLADAGRRPIWPVLEDSMLPQDGKHVFLCMDVAIQGYLQEAVVESLEKFKAKWGVGIVVNPNTGQILGMCSMPSFDPNEFATTPMERMTNKAICAPYEPGSAFKSIIAAAAVDDGVVNYQTPIFCENGTYIAPRGGRISDHGASYGELPLTDVIVYSSNIGMAKVGEKLGNRKLFGILGAFGFGRDTGIDLPGESPGIVRLLHKWDGYSTRRVPFGQEVSVTSLQLVMAYAAITNGGLLLKPRIVDFVNDASGRTVWKSQREVVRRVLKESTCEETLGVLQQVVERGTGKACKLDRWTSFGKTGTAQIPGQGGYIDGAFVGTFVGGAPVGRAEVLCLISIYWPNKSLGHFGATVAAPYVKKVLSRTLSYLNVPPDVSSEAPMTAQRPGEAGEVLAAARGD